MSIKTFMSIILDTSKRVIFVNAYAGPHWSNRHLTASYSTPASSSELEAFSILSHPKTRSVCEMGGAPDWSRVCGRTAQLASTSPTSSLSPSSHNKLQLFHQPCQT
jgi:hypothetical protein